MTQKRSRGWLDVSYLSVIVSAAITVFVVHLVFIKTQDILKERLRERLIAIASTAALQFDPGEMLRLRSKKAIVDSDIDNVVNLMNRIRASNKNLKFIYLLAPTEVQDLQKFIADADSLGTLEELDENSDGILDEEEIPPQPGEDYDTSELPAFREALSGTPTADYDLNSDKWGTFLSGYAPIVDSENSVIAILGIDVEVSDFNILVRATLIPFVALSSFLFLILITLTIILTRIWRNRVEVVKELDRQKDELLGMVSHQLATPMSAIKWNLEMMLDGDEGKLTKEQTESLISLQGVAGNLTDLVSMILDVSRIQLGRMKVDKVDLDLSEFFKEILAVIEPKAKEKKVDFKVSIPTSFPKAVLDKRYTHMTIENLLSNAIKYTPEKGRVSFKVEVKKGIMYCEVKDTGVGIPAQEQDKIFGKMFRASNVRNSVDGNGFGLYVAKGAIESQGGKIWFKSEEGKGTTFFIELPINSK